LLMAVGARTNDTVAVVEGLAWQTNYSFVIAGTDVLPQRPSQG
jgi:hypothetical protein